MTRIYAYLAAVAATLAIIGYAAWTIDSKAYARGFAASEALHQKAAAEAQTAIDLRDQRTAETRISILDLLRVTIPPIEIRSHETIERIRLVYRDNPVPVGACVRPERVFAELDAARDRANASVSAL